MNTKKIALTIIGATTLFCASAQKENFKFKMSGRALFDQATYFDQKNVDLKNGVAVGDIRIGLKAYYGKWYLRSEASLKQNKVSMKDFYLQYSFEKINHLRLGYYTVPFGLQSSTGSADKEFLSDPESNIFQPGRRIGIMHTYATSPLWIQYGVFADNSALKTSTDKSGSQGFMTAARFIVQPLMGEDYALHLGFSGAHIKAEATKAGDHAAIKYSKGWMTNVDKTKAIGADITDARWENKFTPEIAAYWRNIMISGQYFWSHIKRDAIENAIGKNRFNSDGMYVTLRGIIINPANYSYNKGGAGINPPRNNNLELGLGFGYANFNDKKAQALATQGIYGGKMTTYNAGLSYYINKYVTIRAEYDFMKVTAPNTASKHTNAIQFRVQYKF